MIIDSNFSHLLERVFAGRTFDRNEAEALVTAMIDGRLSDTRVAAVLTCMRFASAATLPEIFAGALESLARHRKKSFTKSLGVIDLAGIGSRGVAGSPVAVMAGVLAAAAGARVALFGSKSFSGQHSNTEFADLLGIRLAQSPTEAESDLNRSRLTFLRASAFYPPFQHLTSVRKSLGFHTLFDILIPLANPAPLKGQVLGIFDSELLPIVAQILKNRERALVVHAEDGTNEISVGSANRVAVIENGIVREEVWHPADIGCEAHVGQQFIFAEDAIEIATELLAGRCSDQALVQSVCLNAAAGLWCAGLVPTLPEGLSLARHTLQSGAALRQLETWQHS